MNTPGPRDPEQMAQEMIEDPGHPVDDFEPDEEVTQDFEEALPEEDLGGEMIYEGHFDNDEDF